SLVVVFFSLSKIVPSLQLEASLLQYLVKGIQILIIFLLAILAMRIGSYALSYFKIYVEKTDSKLDDQLLPIVQKMLRILIALVAISLALKQLNVNLTAIIAGLSIGGLALALASQDTVKNFIGSITIFLDHPFEIGDYIVISETEGTVEEVGMRATRIRTPNQSLAYVPNGQLSNMVIDNIGLRIYRRWKLYVGFEYASSSEQLESFCQKAKIMLDRDFSDLAAEKTSVQLSELASSSINIFLNLFLNVKTYDEELQSKHRILLALMKLAKEEGLEFAYPSQTLYLKRP
ncbi:MAG: mechanosensitive ion channel family protein, partial [Bacteroidetes bacterium]|nr:mechanosensitive ion channel family protein [Bacteroidota bacterium]